MPGSERDTDGPKSHSQAVAELCIRGVRRGPALSSCVFSPLPPKTGLLVSGANLGLSEDEANPAQPWTPTGRAICRVSECQLLGPGPD